jgi:hypothetical protein
MDGLLWYMHHTMVILILFNILFQKEQILKQKAMIFSLIKSSLWMDFLDMGFIQRSSWYCSISYFKRSKL